MAQLTRQLGFLTAAFTVIGSMIGSGVFRTSNELFFDVHLTPFVILALWAVGGLVALSGALSYAELAAAYPEAGGEFAYLNRIFGKLPAFLTGFISLTVGFSAPNMKLASLASPPTFRYACTALPSRGVSSTRVFWGTAVGKTYPPL